MLLHQDIIVRRPSRYKLHHIRPGLGPGLEGDYYETKNEELLIQKLNTLRSSHQNQPLVIPPLLPKFKSESTYSECGSDVDNPETFLHNASVAMEEEHSSQLRQQQQQQDLQERQQQRIEEPTINQTGEHNQSESGQKHPFKLKESEENPGKGLTYNPSTMSSSSTAAMAKGKHNSNGQKQTNNMNMQETHYEHINNIERVNSKTSFWQYPHGSSDSAGFLTVEKVPMKSVPTLEHSNRPRSSPPNSSSSPQSVCKYIG